MSFFFDLTQRIECIPLFCFYISFCMGLMSELQQCGPFLFVFVIVLLELGLTCCNQIYGECPKVRRIVTSSAGIWDTKKWIGFYLYVAVTTKPLLFFSLFFSNVNLWTPSFMACFTLNLNHNKCDVLYFQIYIYTQLTSEILCTCSFPFTFHTDFIYMATLLVCFHYI